MLGQRLSRVLPTGLFAAIALVTLLLAGCGTDDGASSSDRPQAGGLQKVTPSDRIYTIEDVEAAGVKTLHHYDVAELPEALDAWHLSFKPEGVYLEYEARFYSSHDDAVAHGTAWAEAAAGETAIVVGEGVLWEEGSTHRRKCSRAAETPHSGCAYSARYGDFITLGNMILLCEGPNSEEAMTACKAVYDKLN